MITFALKTQSCLETRELPLRELPLPLNTFLELRDDSLMFTDVYRVVDNKSCKVTYTEKYIQYNYIE